ncbi:hypothetical protein ACLKA6_016991 [Drosophila palustris]
MVNISLEILNESSSRSTPAEQKMKIFLTLIALCAICHAVLGIGPELLNRQKREENRIEMERSTTAELKMQIFLTLVALCAFCHAVLGIGPELLNRQKREENWIEMEKRIFHENFWKHG